MYAWQREQELGHNTPTLQTDRTDREYIGAVAYVPKTKATCRIYLTALAKPGGNGQSYTLNLVT